MDADSPIVEEVRRRRHELSERFGHDLRKYAEHLHEIEKEYQNQLVNQVTVIRAPERKTREEEQ